MTDTTTRCAVRHGAHRNRWFLGIGTLTIGVVVTVFPLNGGG